MPSLADAVGAIGIVVADEHLLTSFLSSPATIRNMYVSSGRDLEGVRTDLNIALGLGIALTMAVALTLKSWFSLLFGLAFGAVFYFTYKYRAGL